MPRRTDLMSVVVLATLLLAAPAFAQSAPATPAATVAAPAATTPPLAAAIGNVPTGAGALATAAAVALVPPKSAPKPQECTRLPLTDIAFGREATIAQAQMRLGEYAGKEAKKRGWSSYAKSAEMASCEVYIDFGPLVGTEYKCLIAATFCRK
jgi:hypothetical protein